VMSSAILHELKNVTQDFSADLLPAFSRTNEKACNQVSNRRYILFNWDKRQPATRCSRGTASQILWYAEIS
jgi:hypothetical protein